MKIETHMKNSVDKCGIEGRDIHEWIDGHFEHDKFALFLRTGILPVDWNPYDHRVHRHCEEAFEECVSEFRDKYSEDEIRAVFESHLLDDYHGYIPKRDDFLKSDFHDKYHTL